MAFQKIKNNSECTGYGRFWGNDRTDLTLMTLRKSPWVAGQFAWTGFDYLGECFPFHWPVRNGMFGIIDLAGFPKDSYYIYQADWTDEPSTHIIPQSWNFSQFFLAPIPVWVYSNCEEVELFVNNRSLGVKKINRSETLHAEWLVKYEAGELKAVGRTNGQIVCTDIVRTAGDPVGLEVLADRSEIAADGRLMEWRLPFEETSPGHRHISHVIGAYPGNVIDLDDDPVMRSAVIKSIEGRMAKGGAGTGWSRAWTIGMYARFSDGESAYENFHAILAKSTLDNLWDTCDPFQIDGNFGATAAIAEMLLHSHNGEIKLLPAVPSRWSDISIKGLRARGDYTVDITRAGGELATATIHAGDKSTGEIRVIYQNKSKTLKIEPGKSATLTRKDF